MSEKIEQTIIRPQAGFQEQFAASSVDVVFGGGAAGGGKALPLDAHVVTPYGLICVGDIRVGDAITNPVTGGVEHVIWVHPIEEHPYYSITFADGTRVECSEGHLWSIRISGKDIWHVRTTKMLFEYLHSDGDVYPRRCLSIPMCAPVRYGCHVPLPVPPYVLGVLIGDGCMSERVVRHNRGVRLSTPDEYIVSKMSSLGCDMSRGYADGDNCRVYVITDKWLLEALQTMGMLGCKADTKFIPDVYMYASVEDRCALVCGLMDTDGYVDARGHMSYTTASGQLAKEMAFVIRSLGGRVTIRKRKAGYVKDGVHIPCKPSYKLFITMPEGLPAPVVSLPKKADRVRRLACPRSEDGRLEKRIKGIDYIGIRDGRCITVDNPHGLFLTDDFTVTHNSYGLVLAMAEPLMTDPDFRALITRRSMSNLKQGGGFVDTFKEIFGEYATVRESKDPRVSFDSGAYCDLTYISDNNLDAMRERAKGWQYDMIAMDELTEIPWETFTYLMSRNRGRSRTFTGKFFATMNPKRNHWVRQFIDWYIGVDGFIRPERNGRIRYFYNTGSTVKDVVWGSTKEEVYRKCRIDIDRKLRAIGGGFTYENLIKSFVFYQGKISENKGLLKGNQSYVGSVAASGGAMSQALVEGNWNVDPDEVDHSAISSEDARRVFIGDPMENGDFWITVDLADVGTDNVVALAWNGFHVFDMLIITHSEPRQNAQRIKALSAERHVPESHIIYDATSARYFHDYLPEALPYVSGQRPRGMYALTAMTMKDLCYLRLCNMLKHSGITFSTDVAERVYNHVNMKYPITVENEFLEECSVVHFRQFISGKQRLDSKREMNQRLGRGRSMDLLDPCAMRMLPCVDMEYGTEFEAGLGAVRQEQDVALSLLGSVYDENIWC